MKIIGIRNVSCWVAETTVIAAHDVGSTKFSGVVTKLDSVVVNLMRLQGHLMPLVFLAAEAIF
jgi:hypothetical protein